MLDDISPRDVISTAREWIGTPVMHQASLRGVGSDCAGLVRGVGADLGLFPRDDVEFWKQPGAARWRAYGREPTGNFLEAFDTFFNRDEAVTLGGIVVIRLGEQLRHCGIVGNHPAGGFTIIHALYERVHEHRLDSRWLSQIGGFYRYRGVTYGR